MAYTFNQIDQGGARPAKKRRPSTPTFNQIDQGGASRRTRTATSPSSSPSTSSSAPTRSSKAATKRQMHARILRKLIKDDSESLAPLTSREKTYWERRTSEKGVEAAAKRRAERLYKDARRVTGLSGPVPEIKFDGKEKEGILAYVRRDRVHLPPTAAAMLGAASATTKKDRATGSRLALHEFAHTQQKQRGGYTPYRDEGRAVRFSRAAARKLDIPKGLRESPEYKRYTRRSKRVDPKKKIVYGQFGEGQGKGSTPRRSGLAKRTRTERGQRVQPGATYEPKKREKPKARIDEKRVATRLTRAAKRAGSTVQISGPLTEGQKQFGKTLAKKTGLSPRVIGTWMLAEQSGGAAQDYDNRSYFNYLNIGPHIEAPEYSASPQSAAKATARFLKGKSNPAGAAGANIPSIVTAAGKPDAEQMRMIEQSGWSATGYGAGGADGQGPLLSAIYPQVGGKTRPKKPIPQRVKAQARETLGPKKTKQIIRNTRSVATSAPTKKPGPYAGSKAIIRELIGPYAKTEDWKDKEDRGDPGGTFHDIGTTNAYAADLSVNEDIIDRIARKLGLDPKEVNYGTQGLESGITYKGYEIQFLPYTHGSGPHIHIGAKWTGAPSVPGTSTSSGGTWGNTSGTSTTTSGGKGTTPTTQKTRRRSRSARARKQLLNEILNTPDAPQVDVMEGFEPRTQTTAKRIRARKVSLGL